MPKEAKIKTVRNWENELKCKLEFDVRGEGLQNYDVRISYAGKTESKAVRTFFCVDNWYAKCRKGCNQEAY